MSIEPTQSSEHPQSSLDRWQIIIAGGLLLYVALWLFETVFVRPAWCDVDEWAVLNYIQRSLEGGSWHLRLATGGITRLAQAASAWLLGSQLSSLRLPLLISFLSETLLLAWLAGRWFGREASLGTVLIQLISAHTFLRTRSLLSFGVLPAEMLGLIYLLIFSNKNKTLLFVFGLGASLFLLDYEAWPLALLVILLVAVKENLLKSLIKPLTLMGALAGLSVVLFVSWDSLATWIHVRSTISINSSFFNLHASWIYRVLDYFFGGTTIAITGIPGYPALAPWSWPLLALGILGAFKSQRWLLGWVFIGMLPLLLPASGVEVNRVIVAWPAWCLLGGLGFAHFVKASKEHFYFKIVLLVLILAGLISEGQVYKKHMAQLYPKFYATAASSMVAMRWLEKQKPEKILVDLGRESKAHLRFIFNPKTLQPGGGTWAVLDWHYLSAVQNLVDGNFYEIKAQDKMLSAYVVKLNAEGVRRLSAVDEGMRQYWSLSNPFDLLQSPELIENKLLKNPQMDPWLRTSLWAVLTTNEALTGVLKKSKVQELLKENLVSSDPLHFPAFLMARFDKTLAEFMLQKAVDMDAHVRPNPQMLKKLGITLKNKDKK